jgi:molybdate transport system substrate-binding protein
MKRIHPIVIAAVLTVSAAVGALAAQAPARPLRVAAASDLRFALDELVTSYNATRGAQRVVVTYGSSGTFYAQMRQGAPFDMFLSADVSYPRELAANGHADGASLFVYAIGRIGLWVPSASPLDIGRGMEVLRDPRIRHVSIANPLHAPYGRAAEAAMQAAGVRDVVKDKLVLGENITQATQFVESGAADIGIIARSLAFAPQMRMRGRYWDIPAATYPLMEQGGVVLTNATERMAAIAFRAFLLSPTARAVLERHGFVLPER